MENQTLCKYFVDSYLKSGITRDNCVFEEFPKELFPFVCENLKVKNNSIQAQIIEIDHQISGSFDANNEYLDQFRLSIFARSLINGLVMKTMLENLEDPNEEDAFYYNQITEGVSAVINGDFDKSREFYKIAPMGFDIDHFIKNRQNSELVFLLKDMNSKPLQRAINNYLSTRSPYTVKIFSNKNLATILDEAGNLIHSPHDYLKINVKHFLEEQGER